LLLFFEAKIPRTNFIVNVVAQLEIFKGENCPFDKLKCNQANDMIECHEDNYIQEFAGVNSSISFNFHTF
jgi:hypothetical protein